MKNKRVLKNDFSLLSATPKEGNNTRRNKPQVAKVCDFKICIQQDVVQDCFEIFSALKQLGIMGLVP